MSYETIRQRCRTFGPAYAARCGAAAGRWARMSITSPSWSMGRQILLTPLNIGEQFV